MHVPEGVKPPFLPKFDGRIDQCEHFTSINTQMTISGVSEFLKWKLMFGTFKDANLVMVHGYARAFISNYQELVKNLVH